MAQRLQNLASFPTKDKELQSFTGMLQKEFDHAYRQITQSNTSVVESDGLYMSAVNVVGLHPVSATRQGAMTPDLYQRLIDLEVAQGGAITATRMAQWDLAYAHSVFTGNPHGTTLDQILLGAPVSVVQGGTGIQSYAIGDLLYASATTTLSKLADVATGNALISGGVGVAPSWGKIGLNTHVSGTLNVPNGGTGLTTYQPGDLIYASLTDTLARLPIDVGDGMLLKTLSGYPVWGSIDASSLGAGGTFSAGTWVFASASTVTINGTLEVTTAPLKVGGGTYADSGTIRFANNRFLYWRNAANSANIWFGVNASDNLQTNAVGAEGATFTGFVTYYSTSGELRYRTASQVKSDIGLSNVENTALSTWAGSTNITTLGTITTGTWNGSTIQVGKGGTGLGTMVAAGRLLYSSAADTLATLAIGSAGEVLKVVGGFPLWGTIDATMVGAGAFPAGTWSFATTSAVTINGTLNTTSYMQVGGGSYADAGVLRMANNKFIYWRNAGGTANIGIGVNASNALELFGLTLQLDGSTSGAITIAWPATITSHTLTLPSAQGAANSVLKNNGSGALSWGTVAASEVSSGAALTKADDTNVTLTLGGSPSTALLAAASLTLGWTGLLAATRGGTGIGTYAVGDLLYANTTTTLARLGGAVAGEFLKASAGPVLSWEAITVADVGGAVATTRTLTMTGTTNQVSVTNSGVAQDLSANRSWTFSLPQNIHTGAAPTFAGLRLTGGVEFVTNTDFTFNAYYSAGWKYRANGYAADFYQTSSGDFVFLTAPSGLADGAITFTTRLTISNTGGLNTNGGNVTAGTFIGSGASLTSIPAGQLTGTVAATHGGTDNASYAVGDMLYANTTTSLSRLAVGVAGEFLKVTAGPVLDWVAIGVADVSGAAASARTLTMTGTTNQVSVTNSGVALDLTANRSWTFSLPQNIHTAATPTFASVTAVHITASASPASAGAVRLANTDGIYWRNNAGSGDISLVKATDDSFTIGGTGLNASGYLQAYGLVYHRSNVSVVNKAVSGWLPWATRNTAGAEVVIDLAYIGTISAAGNITGIWNGNTIAATKGGTDNASYTVGDILYANTTTSLAKLSVTGSNNYLNWNGSSLGFRTISVGAANVSAGTFPAGTWAFGATSAVTVNGTLAVTDDVTLTQHLKKVNDTSSLGLYGGVSKATGGAYVLVYGKSAAGTTDGFANAGATAIYTDDGTGLLIYKTDSTTPTNTLMASFDMANGGRLWFTDTTGGLSVIRAGGSMPIYLIQADPNVGFNAYYSGGWKYGVGSSAKYAGWLGMPPSTGTLSWVSTTATGNADAAATGTTQFSCDTSGNLVVRGDVTAYGTPSDRRLKENIRRIVDPLSIVRSLNGYTFNWNDKSEHWKLHDSNFERRDAGFIAQEVQSVLPYLVRESDSGYLSMRSQNQLVAILWEAVKELEMRLERVEHGE